VAGLPMKNTELKVRLSITEGSINGVIVYRELHQITTNDAGRFVALIGKGDTSIGVFEQVKWLNGSHFLNVFIDMGDGTLKRIGGSQFLSVPYAFYAHQAMYGPTGDKGERGEQGPVGWSGKRGIAGFRGESYPWDGPVGPQGPQGEIGMAGVQGPQGLQGPSGDPNGPKGYKGPQGVEGPPGKDAPIGEKGSKGQMGPQGSKGMTGPRGEKGDVGPQGPQGERGVSRGDQGPRGPQGLPVADGDCSEFQLTRGPRGLQGLNCWDVNGNRINDIEEDRNGDGLYNNADCQGPQGFAGAKGATGSAGSPGSAHEGIYATPPYAYLHRIYLDNGNNRQDGLPGFRYYNGSEWIDLY